MKANQIILVSCTTLLSGSLFAGSMGPVSADVRHVYVRADLGYNFFNSPTAQTADANNNPTAAINSEVLNNLGYSAGLGYKFNPNFRSDVTFTWRPSISTKATDTVPETGTGSFNNYSLMVNGYYDINLNLPVTPYVMAGVGVSSISTNNFNWPVIQQNEYGQFNQSVTWQVGAGVSYAIQQNLLLDFSYQYVDLGSFSNTGHYDTPGVFNNGLVGTPTSFSTLYSNQIQLGLRYYI